MTAAIDPTAPEAFSGPFDLRSHPLGPEGSSEPLLSCPSTTGSTQHSTHISPDSPDISALTVTVWLTYQHHRHNHKANIFPFFNLQSVAQLVSRHYWLGQPPLLLLAAPSHAPQQQLGQQHPAHMQ
jgi:hypothetical protein